MTQAPGYQPYDPNFGMPPQPQKSWFGRNWLWFVPLLIVLPILCCCGGCGGLIWFGINYMTDQEPYTQSIALVQNSDEVQDAIGSPIEEPGFFEVFQEGGVIEFDSDNSYDYYYMEIPMSGPDGSGWLIVEAQSADGANWDYTTREFQVDGSDVTINFIEEEDADADAEEGESDSGEEETARSNKI